MSTWIQNVFYLIRKNKNCQKKCKMKFETILMPCDIDDPTTIKGSISSSSIFEVQRAVLFQGGSGMHGCGWQASDDDSERTTALATAATGLVWFGSLEPREPIQRRHSSGQLLFAQIRIHGDPCDRL